MGHYDDIIHLQHPTSPKHPRMPLGDRAAQFAPFAALTGYDAAIKETARLTDSQIELDENAKAELDQILRQIYDQLPDAPSVVITYFEPDQMKSGGSYLDKVGKVKKIDPTERSVKFTDGTVIPIECITGIVLSETE